MPRPLDSTTRAQAEHAHVVSVSERKRRELRRTMRDVTDNVQNAPAMPGDTTHNADDRRKSRRTSDKLSMHTHDVAYVVSDTRIYSDDKLVAVKRSPSRIIVRRADGTIDDAATAAVASRYTQWRAANRKDGR